MLLANTAGSCDIGIEISSGQLNNIIIEGHDSFHEEKDAILKTGLSVSSPSM
jgi:hypothetical protein